MYIGLPSMMNLKGVEAYILGSANQLGISELNDCKGPLVVTFHDLPGVRGHQLVFLSGMFVV